MDQRVALVVGMGTTLDTLAPGILIASPTLADPNFDHVVVLICAHNDEGAMGLVINRPAPITARDVMVQMGLEVTGPDRPALIGGPVESSNGLLLYTVTPDADQRPDEMKITDNLRLCPNSEVLQAIAAGEGPSEYYIFLGHAGWGPGQLEQELAQGAWIPGAVSQTLIFEVPMEGRWEHALQAEGLNVGQVSTFRPQS